MHVEQMASAASDASLRSRAHHPTVGGHPLTLASLAPLLHRRSSSAGPAGSTRSDRAAAAATAGDLEHKRWRSARARVRRVPPAQLPRGWQPVSNDFDDVAAHRLWQLEDGSNAGTIEAQRGRSLSTTAAAYNATLTHALAHAGSGDRGGSGAAPAEEWAADGREASPPGHAVGTAQLRQRPASGDLLTRRYQQRRLGLLPADASAAADASFTSGFDLAGTVERLAEFEAAAAAHGSPSFSSSRPGTAPGPALGGLASSSSCCSGGGPLTRPASAVHAQLMRTPLARNDSREFAKMLRALQAVNRDVRAEVAVPPLLVTAGGGGGGGGGNARAPTARQSSSHDALGREPSLDDDSLWRSGGSPTFGPTVFSMTGSFGTTCSAGTRQEESCSPTHHGCASSPTSSHEARPQQPQRVRDRPPCASAAAASTSACVGGKEADGDGGGGGGGSPILSLSTRPPRPRTAAVSASAAIHDPPGPRRADCGAIARPQSAAHTALALVRCGSAPHNSELHHRTRALGAAGGCSPARRPSGTLRHIKSALEHALLVSGRVSPPPACDGDGNYFEEEVGRDAMESEAVRALAGEAAVPVSPSQHRARDSELLQLAASDVDGLWAFEVAEIVDGARQAHPWKLDLDNDSIDGSVSTALLSPHFGGGGLSSGAGTPLATPTTRNGGRASARLKRKILDLERQQPNLLPRITVEFFDVADMALGTVVAAIERKPTFITPRASRSNSLTSETSLAEPRVVRGLRRRSSFADFINNEEITPESSTHFPPQELHLYQLYCLNTDTIIIFRPVSPAVPSMYAGNAFIPKELCDEFGIPLTVDEIDPDLTLDDVLSFTTRESRVRGKGIGVSLKSSPYPPIEGFIPVNPHLSKTYSEAQKKERLLEEKLMSSNALTAVSTSTSLLRKIRSQRTFFGAATSVAVKEIEASIEASERKLQKLLDEYRAESMLAYDKHPVALRYIDVLNESQFLGKTNATWRGLVLYFRQAKASADIERLQGGQPQFYVRRGPVVFRYNYLRNELDGDWQETFEILQGELHAVEVLTHRSFVISPLSQRIEPDPAGDFIIGPDFDGLAYAQRTAASTTAQEYISFCVRRMALNVVPSMGNVSELDVQHVLAMRELTEWKQNHGYECCNTIKTQELGEGAYVVITPSSVKVALTFQDIIECYREYWLEGFPLLLNPNWKVVIDPSDGLPIVFGDEPALPIIDDCGMAMLKEEIASDGSEALSVEALGGKVEEFMREAVARQRKIDAMRTAGEKNVRVPKLPYSRLVERTALVLRKKSLAERFYDVRRWMLMPPYVRNKSAAGDMLFAALSKSPRADSAAGGGGGGGADGGPQAPRSADEEVFERFRDEKVHHFMIAFERERAEFEQALGAPAAAFTNKLMPFLSVEHIKRASIALEASKVKKSVTKSFLFTPDDDVSEAGPDSVPSPPTLSL